MRKLIVCNIMSLDGYYEGAGKNVMPLFDYRREAYPADESFDAYNAERLRHADTLTPDETAPWHNTRIVRRLDAHAAIAGLKRGPGKDILVFGSRTLWHDLLAHHLVDELHLMIGPTLVGSGTPALAAHLGVSLRLIEARTWAGSGNVLVKYAARKAAS